jgi:hypothetical protein
MPMRMPAFLTSATRITPEASRMLLSGWCEVDAPIAASWVLRDAQTAVEDIKPAIRP